MNAKRIQDAEKLVKKGDEHLKTTMFKWQPDVDSAIECFDKAIIQFRNASDHKNAISMLLRVAKMNETRGNAFHAGKSLDSASAACRDIGDLDGVLAYADQAADLFMAGDVPDTAYNTLCRAAKHVEQSNPEAAVQFYQKAADIYVRIEGGRLREAADVLARASCLQIRQRQFDKAKVTVQRERDLRLEAKSFEAASRTNCCLIILNLACNDAQQAAKVSHFGHQTIQDYDRYDGAAVMDHVIKSASSGKESFEASLKHAYFRSLENDIVKLVKRLSDICEMTEEKIDFNQENATSNADEPDFDQLPETEEAEPDLC